MNPNDHDSKLSSLSHMPHLVSSILSHSLYNEIDAASELCGQGLRVTLLDSWWQSDLWTGIIEKNHTNILESLKNFENSLKIVRSLISEK